MGLRAYEFWGTAVNIALLMPPSLDQARGNIVTVKRWSANLNAAGHHAVIFQLDSPEREQELRAGKFDLIHAHHALHCGVAATLIAKEMKIPLVVSLGGTDLHESPDGLRRSKVEGVIATAQVIVGSSESDGQKLAQLKLACRQFAVVRRGIDVPQSSLQALSCSPDQPLRLIYVGGIRRVKDPLLALRLVENLRGHGLAAHMQFFGPAIEADYVETFREAIAQSSGFASWSGSLSPQDTREAIRHGQVLVNSSQSEGAANAILEALVEGRVVVAKQNFGNVAMLDEAPASCAQLFSDDDESFRATAQFLTQLRDQTTIEQQKTSQSGRQFILDHYNAQDELADLLAAYKLAMATHT